MKLLWSGEPCVAPGLGGLLISPGVNDYPDEHAETLLAIGLTAAEVSAPPKRGRKGGEEEMNDGAR